MPGFIDAERLSDIFTVSNIFIYLGISLANTVLLLLVSYKFLQTDQQSGYEGYGYFKWLRRHDNVYLSRLAILSMMSLLGFLMINVALSPFDSAIVFYVGFVFYIVFVLFYFRSDLKRIKKLPLNYTPRMKRLIVAYFAVLFLISFGFICLLNLVAFYLRSNELLVRLRFSPVCLMPLSVPFFVMLAHYVMQPYELRLQQKYIKKCMKKLYDRSDLIKIAVTGSYGKTSVKEILRSVLEEKYRVLTTLSSYNNAMEICRAVERLKDEHKVFIAEMGVRKLSDIKEFVGIVRPDFAIINGITGRHLETVGPFSAVKQTNRDFAGYMENGAVAYTVDNETTISLFGDCGIKKSLPAGLDLSHNPVVYAKDIELKSDGSDFTLCRGEETARCHTALLGSHNISNICLACSVCFETGMTMDEICAGIKKLAPVPHRLSVIKEGGVTVLDDSYNSDIRGIDAALDVLKLFDGRKIVITPGLLEIGYTENMEAYRFGKKLATVADIVILAGRSASFIMKEGLVSGGFNPENILTVKNIADAKKKLSKMVKEGDVVLYENDLPDKFA